MNLLLISEIGNEISPPDFGGEFAEHIAEKRNPVVRRASLKAWNLLAEGLARLGYAWSPARDAAMKLPAIRFGENGKPEFDGLPLHFSLAHSGKLAAALLSDAPCGVDIERVRPEVADRLRERCLSPEELRRGMDFFECWTKKECVGKLTGMGIGTHPANIDTLDGCWENRSFTTRLHDSSGLDYTLSALCEDATELRAVWV